MKCDDGSQCNSISDAPYCPPLAQCLIQAFPAHGLDTIKCWRKPLQNRLESVSMHNRSSESQANSHRYLLSLCRFCQLVPGRVRLESCRSRRGALHCCERNGSPTATLRSMDEKLTSRERPPTAPILPHVHADTSRFASCQIRVVIQFSGPTRPSSQILQLGEQAKLDS